MSIVIGPKWPVYSCCNYIGLLGTCFMQVMYVGRASRAKETLPDFRKWCRVTRHPLIFRELTGSQRTPGNGASQKPFSLDSYHALTPTVLGCLSAYGMHDANSITVYNTCKYINMNIFT